MPSKSCVCAQRMTTVERPANSPETWLGRKETAEALTASGFPTSAATLSTKASRGGGPPFSKYGSRALYRWGSSLAWAQSRLTPANRGMA
jgi:hypothetical protein